jgi:hypothetical protein
MVIEDKNIQVLKVTKVVKKNDTDDDLNISDLLHQNEMFSKDLKQKINNKQLLLNGEPLTWEQLKIKIDSFDEAGDFVFKNIESIRPVSFLNLEEMFEVNIPFIKTLLNGLFLLKVAKKKWFVITLK